MEKKNWALILEVLFSCTFKELRLIQGVRDISEAALWPKYKRPDGIIKNFQFLVQQTEKLCDVNIVIRDRNKEMSQSLELSRNMQDL